MGIVTIMGLVGQRSIPKLEKLFSSSPSFFPSLKRVFGKENREALSTYPLLVPREAGEIWGPSG